MNWSPFYQCTLQFVRKRGLGFYFIYVRFERRMRKIALFVHTCNEFSVYTNVIEISCIRMDLREIKTLFVILTGKRLRHFILAGCVWLLETIPIKKYLPRRNWSYVFVAMVFFFCCSQRCLSLSEEGRYLIVLCVYLIETRRGMYTAFWR